MRSRFSGAGRQALVASRAPEREAFQLTEFFAKARVVEAGIGGAGPMQDAVPHALRPAAMAGPSATGVSQSRLTALPIARLESFDMLRR